mmetsp:Transcript_38557/g.115711  ORF Transcript_38557/g.115711 Transcript_38557/m.115711 type:complete len:369 (+) Transcript_38557:273-1379(+)
MHVHHGVRAPRRPSAEQSGIDRHRPSQHRSRERRQPRRHEEYVRLDRHGISVHTLEIEVGGRDSRTGGGGREEGVVAPLLDEMLGQTGHSRSRLEVGVRLVLGHVKEDVGGRDSNREFVDPEGAGVRNEVDAFLQVPLGDTLGQARGFDVLQAQGAVGDPLGAREIQFLAAVGETIGHGWLGVDKVGVGIVQAGHEDELRPQLPTLPVLDHPLVQFLQCPRHLLHEQRFVSHKHPPPGSSVGTLPLQPQRNVSILHQRLTQIHEGSRQEYHIGILLPHLRQQIVQRIVIQIVRRRIRSGRRHHPQRLPALMSVAVMILQEFPRRYRSGRGWGAPLAHATGDHFESRRVDALHGDDLTGEEGVGGAAGR